MKTFSKHLNFLCHCIYGHPQSLYVTHMRRVQWSCPFFLFHSALARDTENYLEERNSRHRGQIVHRAFGLSFATHTHTHTHNDFAQRKIVSHPQMLSLISCSYSIAAVIGNQGNFEKGCWRAEPAPNLFKTHLIKVRLFSLLRNYKNHK